MVKDYLTRVLLSDYHKKDMKKLIALTGVTQFLTMASNALAAVDVKVTRPTGSTQGIDPNTTLGTIIGSALVIVLVFGAIAVLFMLVFGAFEWITSGGDKESVSKARSRIVNALIGLAILAIAFVLVRVVGLIVNIDLLNLSLPTLEGK